MLDDKLGTNMACFNCHLDVNRNSLKKFVTVIVEQHFDMSENLLMPHALELINLCSARCLKRKQARSS